MQLKWYTLLILFLLLVILSSCVNVKKATYFYNMPEGDFKRELEQLEPVIQKNDVLSITVNSLSKEASIIFNTTNLNTNQQADATSTLSPAVGYLVDHDGNIKFPLLGKIKAEGMTKKELTETITKQLESKSLLYEPIVDIRILNYKISVLGEVNRPAVFTIPNEKITLLEALGLAGDLTIYAKRDNILLIREENGLQQVRRIDLTTSDYFKSPYYYLKSNDIVYVEPNKSKIASSSRATQWFPVLFSVVTLGIVVIDRLAN